jgi:hypothetical protein
MAYTFPRTPAPLSEYRRMQPSRRRYKANTRRANGAPEIAVMTPADQRRGICIEAAKRGWAEWEILAILPDISELEMAWYRKNRRVTA